MTARVGLLAALLFDLAPAVQAAEPPAPPATAVATEVRPDAKGDRQPAAVLDEISGTVRAVDRQRHAVTIETAGGRVDVLLDRNTLVYQPGGATTVLSIAPGAIVKTGVDSARRAFWVQLRPPSAEPAPKAAEPATTPAASPPPTEAPAAVSPHPGAPGPARP